jgi:GTA TIM-barrel-like domain/Putative phage tail protein
MSELAINVASNVAVAATLSVVSSFLQKGQHTRQNGSRLTDMQLTSASEGATVKRLWGRSRVGGEIIWATKFKETTIVQTTSQGGKGGPTSTAETVNYTYSCSFAVAFCEGNARTQLGRVWADGKLLDLSKIVNRFYRGTSDQLPDPLIEAKEGTGTVPAFRGICYLVFDNVDLTNFGNRIPQITAEIICPLQSDDVDDLENSLKGVCLIPSAGEFILGSQPYVKDDTKGNTVSENVHNAKAVADLVASLDNLQDTAPNIATVSLVVSWFGTDLRCNSCEVKPKVEVLDEKFSLPYDWQVSNVTRATATAVTTDPATGRPAYGGTPSDRTVREAVIELKARGLRVVFYPFILMDISPTNTLTDPYDGSTGQPAYPWRGRITCNPAIGQAGTPDKTATATTQVNTFLGTVGNSDYGTWNGSSLPYTGATQWSYRRMILHYANLLKDLLGTNDVFIIGSEMRGLSDVRSSSSSFPFVSGLVTLAADVSAVLPSGVKVSYAADWSEYHSYRPADGSNDVYFHLDPLWASSHIDFIGIDAYFPGADWRDGTSHADYNEGAGITNIYNETYLSSQVEGGEYYDYYYANDTARTNQTRTAITDVAYSKPWVFRQKDIRGWWNNLHYNRPAGIQSASATSWVPTSKPIWFTEFGCPAVDKGANQPNVFVDKKSSESYLPYFSNGRRDDLMQRQYNEVLLKYWKDNGGSMISPANMLAWSWDARPYPEFPFRSDIWSDGENWRLGHWLTGRLGIVPLAKIVTDICALVGLTPADIDVTGLYGSDAVIRGFLVEDLASPRSMLESLERTYNFDSFESEGLVRFNLRINSKEALITLDDFVSDDNDFGGYSITRTQETELPANVKLTFYDEEKEYQVGTADARKMVGSSQNVTTVALPFVLSQDYARGLGETILQETWSQREGAEFVLPPSMVRFDPSDVVNVVIKNRTLSFKIQQIDTGETRACEAVSHDSSVYESIDFSGRTPSAALVPIFGRSVLSFLDIPLVTGQETSPWAPRLAAYQSPWPGAVNVYKDDNAGGFALNTQVGEISLVGELVADFYPGVTNKWDMGNAIYVDLYDPNSSLYSATDLAVLNGANTVAIENESLGEWEIVQFVTAELIGGGPRYKLSRLLRGQLGTEQAMGSPFIPTGAKLVVLNNTTLIPLNLGLGERLAPIAYRYGPGGVTQSDFRYQQQTKSFKGIGLRPYSPVALDATKDYISGDVLLSWKRRTRFGGDSWEQIDVPLNEEYERYEIEILHLTGALFRTVAVANTTSYLYTNAQQLADFGAPVTGSIRFRVYQLSSIYGRGTSRDEILYL